jgi:hypothetical protein
MGAVRFVASCFIGPIRGFVGGQLLSEALVLSIAEGGHRSIPKLRVNLINSREYSIG